MLGRAVVLDLPAMPENDLRLTPQTMKQLMDAIDPESSPKPCDYFNIIGGTSTGGYVVIVLSNLPLTRSAGP